MIVQLPKIMFLFFDLPVTFNLGRRDDDNNPIGGDYPVVWNDKHTSRVGLQNKKTDEIIWIEVNPGFFFT